METSPVVIAALIARMKSKRLPRKALADVCGKPLLERIVDHLRAAKTIDRIVLCTSDHPDDHVLVEFAQKLGLDFLEGSQDDVLSRMEEAAKRFKAQIVIRVTGDNVFTNPENIDTMVREHIRTGADYTRMSGLPWGVTAEVLSVSMFPTLSSVIPDRSISGYLTLWAFNPEIFRCLILDAPEELRRPNYSLTVDTPEDIALSRRLYSICLNSDGLIDLRRVIATLDQDSNYKGVNPESRIKLPQGETIAFGKFMELLYQRAAKARERFDKY